MGLRDGVFGAVAAMIVFTRRTHTPALGFFDLLAPSIMLGLALGRVGCFLNGCCYGGIVEHGPAKAWAVRFPRHSIPFNVQVQRGQLSPDAPHSLPVHPTQLYSSLNALLLFALLSAYYPLRRRDGEVVGLMMLLYPPARFLIEYLRSDEPARWGTGLTISQNVSILVFAAGVAWMLWLRRRPLRRAAADPGPHRGTAGSEIARTAPPAATRAS